MNAQPKALALAAVVDSWRPAVEAPAVASELRRLHAVNVQMLEALQHAEKTLRLYPAWLGHADECRRAIDATIRGAA